MFYEEKIIGGVLCYRSSPDGEWHPVPEERQTLPEPQAINPQVLELVRKYTYDDESFIKYQNVIQAEQHKDDPTLHVLHTADGYVHYVLRGWKAVSVLPAQIQRPVQGPEPELAAATATDSIELDLKVEDSVLQ